MLLAAALLAVGCTKEDNRGPIEELVIGISSSEARLPSEAKTQDSSASYGPKVTKSL